MAIADGAGLPGAICAANASPAEVTLVQYTIEHRVVEDTPEKLIGDKAYDSDPLDRGIEELFGTEVISPNRRGRKKTNQTQDGRKLRRYKRRWKIERLFAWLFNFRRLVVRYEYDALNFIGFIHLACAMILMRYL